MCGSFLTVATASFPPTFAVAGWWQEYDTAIVVTGMIVAMSCALPGVWLVLRQQSMMGDALSHTALPGIVLAFLGIEAAQSAGWLSPTGREELEPVLLAGGAMVVGIATALLTELIKKLGNVESSAALGVVFTTLFALGLLLVRLKADDVDLDADCVLFGQIELVVWDRLKIAGVQIPVAAVVNAAMLLINLLLVGLFFKELRLTAFDPEFADTTGIRSGVTHYLMMGMTAATLVLAFQSVGSILVVALLIVPAATAGLISDKLPRILVLSLLIAAASAALGHILARTLPGWLFGALGWTQVDDAGTAGMMAVACGLFFFSALLLAPQSGLISRWKGHVALQLRMAADDILAALYRFEERDVPQPVTGLQVRHETAWIGNLARAVTLWRLRHQGFLTARGFRLTPEGQERGAQLVRSHRLWESYLHKHFEMPMERFHESAHLVEHFIDQDLRAQLDEELDSPQTDPHGTAIPDSLPGESPEPR